MRVNAAFIGVGAEVLQHTLENQGIYVSAGSACSSHKRAGSPTLTAIDAPREEMESSVRFSFAENNTEDEVDEALAYLKQMLPMLRRYRQGTSLGTVFISDHEPLLGICRI